MPAPAFDLLRGSVDIIVLKVLSWGPSHGLAIARWLRTVTDDALRLDEGSLYPALYRMENRGWIKATWRTTKNNRRTKNNTHTAHRRRQHATEKTKRNSFVEALTKVFTTPPPASAES